MIIFDGIIYSWHGTGGIGVYFEEIVSRLRPLHLDYKFIRFKKSEIPIPSEYKKPRIFERYRKFSGNVDGDVFHSSYYRTPTKSHVKVITTVHDFTYEKHIGGLKAFIHSSQKIAAIKASDFIICVSNNTADDLFRFVPNFPKSKVIVIHNGVGEDYFPLESTEKVQFQKPYVLFVGMRNRYKNFLAAVESVRMTQDLDLRCVGGGPFSKNELQQLKESLPGRHYHMGRVSNDHLNKLYNGAHCLIYPSIYEGFGIPLVEAMKAGCPVLALNASSIPEVVGSSGCLVNNSTPQDFLIGINKLRDTSYRNDLIDSGLSRANFFSWQKTANETANLYKLAMNS